MYTIHIVDSLDFGNYIGNKGERSESLEFVDVWQVYLGVW